MAQIYAVANAAAMIYRTLRERFNYAYLRHLRTKKENDCDFGRLVAGRAVWYDALLRSGRAACL
jgi:hypothetical protein